MFMDSPATIKAFRRSDAAEALTHGTGATADVDDATLMKRYANGDTSAFEAIYTRHKGALYRYLQRMCRDREACNDLFQEVWSKVITTRERYEARAQFSTFLFRVAHNCAVDYFRRAGRKHYGAMDDVTELEEKLSGSEVERPEAQLSEAQLRESFKVALDKLPDEQRNVFVLYEETGLTLEEIGQVTGVSFETAKSRLRYALSKLRHALRQYDPRREAGGTP